MIALPPPACCLLLLLKILFLEVMDFLGHDELDHFPLHFFLPVAWGVSVTREGHAWNDHLVSKSLEFVTQSRFPCRIAILPIRMSMPLGLENLLTDKSEFTQLQFKAEAMVVLHPMFLDVDVGGRKFLHNTFVDGLGIVGQLVQVAVCNDTSSNIFSLGS